MMVMMMGRRTSSHILRAVCLSVCLFFRLCSLCCCCCCCFIIEKGQEEEEEEEEDENGIESALLHLLLLCIESKSAFSLY